jgi:non-canonical purine NTP pyrophosphatase (RdgB/HAM1 family)
MKPVVYVTGNAGKAKYFSKLIGHPIDHKPADLTEIQSLDLEEVVIAKVKEAYAQLKCPVIVEDTALQIDDLGRLPGTFIKWFIDELGLDKICRLADADPDRRAVASCAFAYYDGEELELFMGSNSGKIANSPRGDTSFGWNPIFIPDGHDLTMGEMTDEAFTKEYLKIKPFEKVRKFLDRVVSF